MTIGYNRVIAVVFLILGAINVFLGLWLLALGTLQFSLFIGVLLVGIAFGYFTRPYFLVEPGQVVLPAMLGPLKREFPYRGEDSLKIENGRLYVRESSDWRAVPVRRWLASQADWQALEARYLRS